FIYPRSAAPWPEPGPARTRLMPAVLVVVDAVDGSAPKPTLELLTLARRIGTPAAVVFGRLDSQAVPVLAEYGAAEVYLVPDPQVLDHLVVPKVDALEQ